MPAGDFFSTEKTAVFPNAATLRIELHPREGEGEVRVLKDGVKIEPGEVVDAARLSVSALDAYVEAGRRG